MGMTGMPAPARRFRLPKKQRTTSHMPARRSQPTEPPPRPRLRKSREEAAHVIRARIELGEQLAARINPGAYPPGSLSELEDEYRRWTSYNSKLLRSLFDTDEVVEEYDYWIGVA